MKRVRLAFKFLYYLLSAKNRHGIHSPFVYHLVDKVIYDKTPFPVYHEIEIIRKELITNEKEISIEDYGAGSSVNPSKRRKISEITTHSLKSRKYGQLLFRLVKNYNPNTILELGTSLGITTLYLAKGQLKGKIFTIEACPETSAVASAIFEKTGMEEIQFMNGKFEDIIPDLLLQLPSLDFVFFDGNHRKEPTLSYFKACIEMAGENSVFVFDDIHWSEEMEEAWELIKNHPKVTFTIDLFFIGLVFFRKERHRQHFKIRY